MREPLASVNVFSPQDLKISTTSSMMTMNCQRQHFTRPKETRHRNHTRRHHSHLPLKKILISAYVTILLCLIHHKHRPSTTSGGGGDGPLLLAEAQLRIQHDNKLSWDVSENAPNGTFVGTIRSNDGQTPTFIITEPPGLENELRAAFNFNLLTGDITTNGVLDREQREFYMFVAIFKEFSEVKCTIKVRDINDNAPYFVTNETEYVVEVPENQVARFQLPLVVDADASPNAIREIRILSTNAPKGSFAAVGHDAPARSSLGQNSNLGLPNEDSSSQFTSGIDNPLLAQQLAQQEYSLMITQPVGSSSSTSSAAATSTSAAGGSSPDAIQSSMSSSAGNSAPNSDTPSRYQADLEVVRPLDRENQSSYQLTLEALDGGTPPKTTRLKVLVHVLDVNDNDPVFASKLYKLSIKEDTLKHKPLFRLEATDADLDSNGQISYFYKRHQSTSQAPANVINTNTNTNSSDNNNELSATTSTRLAAAAAATTTTTTTTSSNTNNNLNKQRLQQQQMISGGGGKFAQRQAPGVANTDSYENLAPLMSPSSMTQQQPDQTFPHRTRQQTNYPADQYFDVDIDKGEIFLVRELDYETEQVHEFVIEARDHGKPSRSSNTTVRVTVVDVPDDPPISKQLHEDRRLGNNNNNINVNLNGGEPTSRADASAMARNELDSMVGQHQFNFQNFNLMNWFAQMNSSLLFVIVLVALFSVAFPVCLVKIKSRQPESDYNDTANLNPNSGATKSSPNHSANNIDHSTLGSRQDSLHYRHHDQSHGSARRTNSGPYPSAGGAGGGGGGGDLNGSVGPFGTPINGKMTRYPYMPESSNLYHNLCPPQQRPRHHSSTSHHMVPDSPTEHQMAVGGSRGGTMNYHHSHSHNHHHHGHLLGHNLSAAAAAAAAAGHHHSMDTHHPHNHQQFGNANHTTGSLTYAHHHSRAALLHQAHHHQSTNQLSAMAANATIGSGGGGGGGGICANVAGVCGHSKGGTMNSHHSNVHPPSGSPIPATPNTTHSSGLPMTIHEVHTSANLPTLPPIHHQHAASNQLPPTPCGLQSGPTPAATAFPWTTPTNQGPGSTTGCYPPPGQVAAAAAAAAAVAASGGGGSGSGASGASGGGCSGPLTVHPGANAGGTTTAGSLDSCGTPVVVGCGPIANQPLDRWFDLGVTSQLIYPYEWFGSYNWDYLSDWTPESNNLMDIIREDAPGS